MQKAREIERILVLRLSSLGDIVLTSSFLRSLGVHFPGAKIDYVVRDDFAALASALPGVSQIIAVDRRARFGALLALGRQLAANDYSHVFDLHQSLRSRILVHRLGRRLRPGFNKQTLPRWLLIHMHRNMYERFGGTHSLRQRTLQPLVRLGLQPTLHDTQLVLSEGLRRSAGERLAGGGISPAAPLVGVVPGSRWASKRWPIERFSAAVRALSSDAERRFIFLGEAQEAPLAAQLTLAAPNQCNDFCGQLDLIETAALVERCDVVLTNDSGLMHVAEAVGTPVVALFGPTAPAFGYAPYRTASQLLYHPPACSPCSKNGKRPCARPTHECMLNIAVDDAVSGLEAVLDTAQAAASR